MTPKVYGTQVIKGLMRNPTNDDKRLGRRNPQLKVSERQVRDLGLRSNWKESSRCVSSVLCAADLDQGCAKHWRILAHWTDTQVDGWGPALLLDISLRGWEMLLRDVLGDPFQARQGNPLLLFQSQERSCALSHLLLMFGTVSI